MNTAHNNLNEQTEAFNNWKAAFDKLPHLRTQAEEQLLLPDPKQPSNEEEWELFLENINAAYEEAVMKHEEVEIKITQLGIINYIN